MTPIDEQGRPVKSVQLTCELMKALRELDGAGVTELAEHLGRSKGAIHNHLSTLRRNEFVVKDENQYRLGLRFLNFGTYTKKQVPIYNSAVEATDKLAVQSGEVAHFAVEEQGWTVYLHKKLGDNAVRTPTDEGGRRHLHMTALGKALLSQFPDEQVEAVIDRHGLPRKTENTITEEDELFAELAETRERGWSYDDEEIRAGLRCVAAPVLDQQGQLQGAVSISGPLSRFNGERFRNEIPQMLLDAANVIKINSTTHD